MVAIIDRWHNKCLRSRDINLLLSIRWEDGNMIRERGWRTGNMFDSAERKGRAVFIEETSCDIR